MSDISPLPPPEPTYQAIEATLAGHERGRRFLAEHARRSRHEETAALLDAVARLHERSAEAAAIPGVLDMDLPTLRDLTASAEASLADATSSPRSEDDDVFDMMEGIQETAWTMREAGTDASLCDLLDGLAVRLSRACRGREQRDLALGRARDAVSRLGLHLAGRGPRLAGARGEPDTPESGRGEMAEAADLAIPDGDHQVADPQPAPQARPRRKSRARSAGPERA